jgi:hypothetical protein
MGKNQQHAVAGSAPLPTTTRWRQKKPVKPGQPKLAQFCKALRWGEVNGAPAD